MNSESHSGPDTIGNHSLSEVRTTCVTSGLHTLSHSHSVNPKRYRPRKNPSSRFIPPISAILIAVFTAGCGGVSGPERFPVSGYVTIDGVPLSAGVIRFVPIAENAGPGAMTTISDGSYAFARSDGPVLGEHRVEIEAVGHLPFAVDDEQSFAEAVQRTGRSPAAVNPVPPNYNVNSVLQAVVTGSRGEEFPFELRSPQRISGSRNY